MLARNNLQRNNEQRVSRLLVFLYPKRVWDISSIIILRVANVYLQLIGQMLNNGKCYFNSWMFGLEGVPELPSSKTKGVIFQTASLEMGCPSSMDLVANLAANGYLDQDVDLKKAIKQVIQVEKNNVYLDVFVHDMAWCDTYVYYNIWLSEKRSKKELYNVYWVDAFKVYFPKTCPLTSKLEYSNHVCPSRASRWHLSRSRGLWAWPWRPWCRRRCLCRWDRCDRCLCRRDRWDRCLCRWDRCDRMRWDGCDKWVKLGCWGWRCYRLSRLSQYWQW